MPKETIDWEERFREYRREVDLALEGAMDYLQIPYPKELHAADVIQKHLLRDLMRNGMRVEVEPGFC
jgi:hypothetical protein